MKTVRRSSSVFVDLSLSLTLRSTTQSSTVAALRSRVVRPRASNAAVISVIAAGADVVEDAERFTSMFAAADVVGVVRRHKALCLGSHRVQVRDISEQRRPFVVVNYLDADKGETHSFVQVSLDDVVFGLPSVTHIDIVGSCLVFTPSRRGTARRSSSRASCTICARLSATAD